MASDSQVIPRRALGAARVVLVFVVALLVGLGLVKVAFSAFDQPAPTIAPIELRPAPLPDPSTTTPPPATTTAPHTSTSHAAAVPAPVITANVIPATGAPAAPGAPADDDDGDDGDDDDGGDDGDDDD